MKLQTGPHWTRLLCTKPCRAKPRPPSPNHHMRSSPFWDFMQHNSLRTFRDNLSVSASRVKESQKTEQSMTEFTWHNLLVWNFADHKNFLKKPITLEARLCFHVIRQRNTQTGWSSRGSYSQSLWTAGTVRYAPENRYSLRIVTEKWLLKN